MALNLVELINKELGQERIQHLGTWLGESPDSIQKALSAGVPSLVGGLAQAAKGQDSRLLSTLNALAQEPDPRENFSAALDSNNNSSLLASGQSLLDTLLPDQLDGIITKISQFSGIGQDSVGSLLKAVMPLIMSVIGRQQSDLGLDAGGLSKLLDSQREHVQAALPDKVAEYAANAKSSSIGKILVWVVIIAVIGWVLWQWLLK